MNNESRITNHDQHPEPSPQNLHIMIVAGEASGDAHAASLVRSLQTLNAEATFSGLGGPKMQEAGVEIYEDITRFAVVGFVEVLKHYKEFKRCLDLFLQKVDERKPAAVILVDYPGFNLRLAAALKRSAAKRGGSPKIIYYISPQVWAWKAGRVKYIKKYVDRMLVLFKFEQIFYWKYGLEVDFVGHPLIDHVRTTRDREEILRLLNFDVKKITIGLLPGSREREVETLLPIMAQAACLLSQKDPRLQFLVLKSPDLPKGLFDQALTGTPLPLKVLEGDFYNGVHACDVCMVASGTATLETALLTKPMVVVYKTSFLTWALARLLIRIPYIGLVNIVADDLIVPECIQFDATAEKIAEEIRKIYLDPEKMRTMTCKLEQIRPLLGTSGASRRAAEAVLKMV